MLQIRKPGTAPGAEITGLDLSRSLPDELYARVVEAFHDHEVVVFRDQELTSEQRIACSARFGEIDVNVRSRYTKPGYPEICVVSNIIENGQPIGVTDAGRYWHTDHCYVQKPCRCGDGWNASPSAAACRAECVRRVRDFQQITGGCACSKLMITHAGSP